ncbi:MFS transporter [Ramlibacter henchirensis]|uniref:MFS transporter n=1 Tax=Ramlibacter henchirensis TaxID=204072 RepID=A0A4Z0BV04_9BURK|nr:MFS transporter [Ramlibacter henchirensis]
MRRLLCAKALRGFGDGFVSLLLPAYLLELGWTPFQVGLVATTTLLGSGLLTLAAGLLGQRLGHQRLLLAASTLMAATGVGVSSFSGFWPLMVVAFVGTLNPSGGDTSVFLPAEHALLAQSAEGKARTAAFARYSLVGSLSAAAGALAAAVPAFLSRHSGLPLLASLQGMFLLYAVLGIGVAILYRGLRTQSVVDANPQQPAGLGPSRRRVYTLAALFSLDALGGGFVVQSLLALWLFQRFGLSLEAAASIFFWTGVLTAFSYLVAARIADRIGLVRTMVYTHLPSSLCLIAMPFCTGLGCAIALLLVRSALSQMDVPTRSSYVMAIVTPAERSAAASVTSVPRSLAATASPVLAGYLLGLSSFGWPLVVGGALKIVYDLLLLAMFRRVHPPEEDQVSRCTVPSRKC